MGEAQGLGKYLLGYDELLDACEHYLREYLADGMPVPLITLGRFFVATHCVPLGQFSKLGEATIEGMDGGAGAIVDTAGTR